MSTPFSGEVKTAEELAEQSVIDDNEFVTFGTKTFKKIKFSNLITLLKEKLGVNELNRNLELTITTSSYFPSCVLTLRAGTVHFKCAGFYKQNVVGGTAYQMGTTIPSEYRPATSVLKFIYLSNTVLCRLSIGADGIITITPYTSQSASNAVNINECYVAQ